MHSVALNIDANTKARSTRIQRIGGIPTFIVGHILRAGQVASTKSLLQATVIKPFITSDFSISNQPLPVMKDRLTVIINSTARDLSEHRKQSAIKGTG